MLFYLDLKFYYLVSFSQAHTQLGTLELIACLTDTNKTSLSRPDNIAF